VKIEDSWLIHSTGAGLVGSHRGANGAAQRALGQTQAVSATLRDGDRQKQVRDSGRNGKTLISRINIFKRQEKTSGTGCIRSPVASGANTR